MLKLKLVKVIINQFKECGKIQLILKKQLMIWKIESTKIMMK